ncbi:hypothetical protein MUY27_03395 [Mucilaginibacter sp. RS28]|uniref:Uncharacterized protein n=1 Tax=Mucilaginibacter straminoryzae TaxID=2932774 RepID=A0A9X1WZZ2_9SPHI|nr:hypothetical protein [Mucilaginibacter straminoryzae]MCJ8208737.1 hypothetical protein [Mucilaginibacter straminoryzae]
MNFKTFLTITFVLAANIVLAQKTVTPAEAALTDSICNCITHRDMSQVKTQQQAVAVFTECFGNHTALLMKVADERHVDATNASAMRQIGVDVGMNLLRTECDAYRKLSAMIAQNKVNQQSSERSDEGKLIRIDNKGFNYLVLLDDDKKEHSYLWLEQFAGSEKFVNGIGANLNKRFKITWKEIEVFLPVAKGYYATKQIIAVSPL